MFNKFKKNIVLIMLFALIFGTMSFTIDAESEKALIKKLSPKYKQWLDIVTHIMAKVERRSFLECTNDRDRDVLIDMFWKMRDPTPGTKENEYKAEHIKRFNYANKYFKYGSARPGWMTDRGRIHIILGKPASIDKYEVDKVVHDCQLWSYYGDKRLHLPGQFYVMFYKRNGIGEYRIYDPVADGTYSLLIKTNEVTSQMATASYERSYLYLREEHPVLAMASLSLVPDENPTDFRPTFRSQTLIRNVFIAPLKRVNTKYATDFSSFKGIVNVQTTVRYINSKHRVNVIKERGTGLNFVHFSILPEKVSAAYSEVKDKYYFHYKMTVILKQGKLDILRYEKNFPVYVEDESEIKSKFSNSVIISDFFPVPAGKYKLKVILNNSVNGELIYFDEKITVKEESNLTPIASRPMVTKNVKEVKRFVYLPYKFGDIEAIVNPDFNFGKKDPLYIVGSIDIGNYKGNIKGLIEIEDIFNKKKYSKSSSINLDNRRISYFKYFINTVPPGNYKVRIKILSENGEVLDMKNSSFSVNLNDFSKTPGNVHKLARMEKKFLYFHMIGHQYKKLKKKKKEFKYIKRAFELNKTSANIIMDYSDLLLKKKDYQTVLNIIEAIKEKKGSEFIYYFIKGKTLYMKGSLNEAIDNLEKANSIYDSDIRVLNILGTAYIRIGNKEQGIKALEASLKINKHQKNVRKALEEIKKNKAVGK